MKKTILFSTVLSVLVAVSLSSCNSTPSASLKTDVDSVSYAIGMSNGVSFKRMIDGAKEESNVELNVDDLLAGFITAVKGDSLKMNEQEAAAVMQSFFTKIDKKISEENLEAGKLYKVITEGKGAKPKTDSMIKVHYKGTKIDGTEFDSSYSRNQPAELPLNRMIPAWIEGIPMMSVGSKYVFYVPSDLAYGEIGHGIIKPNETLIFEVELLDILPENKK